MRVETVIASWWVQMPLLGFEMNINGNEVARIVGFLVGT